MFRTSPQGALAALDLNTYNLMFITVGLLLHWRPKRFMRAVAECVPATGGVLIQFPFYAVIFGMIVGTGIADALAKLFASISTHNTYPLLVAIYSAVLGVFVPSGGSKWVIEAPYVLQAANLASSASGMGGADLQRVGSAAQSGQSLLDAAATRHSEIESQRHCRIRRAAVDGSHSGRILLVLALCPLHSVPAADQIKIVDGRRAITQA